MGGRLGNRRLLETRRHGRNRQRPFPAHQPIRRSAHRQSGRLGL